MDTAMISSFMEQGIRAFGLCGGLLLLGTFLRAKIKFFQNLYIPACVIGGVIGLILSPTVMGSYAILPITDETNIILSKIGPTLFMLIMAGLPMCSAKLSVKTLKEKTDVWLLALLISIIFALQFAIGFAANWFFDKIGMTTYPVFGSELAQGYTGGHSIAGMVGATLEGLPYSEVSVGVTLTTATVGIIGGIIWGIVLINYAARKGYTHYIKSPAEIPQEMKTGFYKSVEDQPSMGKQTTVSSSIDSVALHLSLMLIVTLFGYMINDLVQANQVPILKEFSAWVYMLLGMYIVWPIICRLGLDKHFNGETKSKITGTITEFIVISAIISIPLALVMKYWIQIVTICVLGLIFTPLVLWLFAKRYFKEDWVEKIMGPMGMNHGDFITGVLLIKMVDPEMKSNAIEDFSLGYTLHNFYALALFVFIYPYVINHGAGAGALMCMAHVAIMTALTIILGRIFKREKDR